MNRLDLRLPTALLLDAAGRVVRTYRGAVDGAIVARDAAAIDAPPAERLSRAMPFTGTLYGQPPLRNYLPYGRELQEQGLEAAAVVAFERAAKANPNASTLYRLGTLLTKSGEIARAREAFERALALKPDLAEASNDLGALLAQGGDLEAAIARFRAALAAAPDYPDALNNLGYALLLSGQDAEARALYEKALALQPDFPEAINNLGLLFGRAGDLDTAEQDGHQQRARPHERGEPVALDGQHRHPGLGEGQRGQHVPGDPGAAHAGHDHDLGQRPDQRRRLGGAQGDPRLPAGAGDLAQHGPRVAPGQLGRVVEDAVHAGAVPGFSASSISMTGMSSRTGYR